MRGATGRSATLSGVHRGRLPRYLLIGGLVVVTAVGAALAGRLLASGPPSPAGTAPPPASGAKVVWAVGDGPDGDPEPDTVARLIASRRVDRLLYLGDVYEDGTRREYREYYAPAYGRLDRVTSPTPGNHEWGKRDEGYDPYWERAGLDTDPHYYSFKLAGWQILSLNSEGELSRGGAQVRWLRGQVSGRGNCRLAFWHRPRYSAGKNHGDDAELAPLWNTLAGRASIVLTAHDHNMQRLEPRDGITSFVSGAGGTSHYPIERDYDGLAFWNDTDYGALRLELRPGRADFAFIATDGRTLDSGTVPCRR